MKWTVLWHDDAENGLAALWVGAADKQAMTAAANIIDHRLRRDPLGIGESRADDDRVLFEDPLGVLYTVNSGDRKVIVLRVWQTSN